MNGKAVALVAGGGIILYSGIRGKSISSAIHNVLSGESPAGAQPAHIITGQNFTSFGQPGGIGTLTGPNSAIGQLAAQDAGHLYHFGGYYTNPLGWDCSSAVNWWLSRFQITLPGGVKNYQGDWHGPVVAQYQLWSGGKAIARNQVQSGDLVLFGTQHMGIATSNNEFVSAQNPANGTAISPIDGFGLLPPNFRRVVR